jgi:hypothetical protein
LTEISVSDVFRTPARISKVSVAGSLGSSVKAPQSWPVKCRCGVRTGMGQARTGVWGYN